MGMGRRVARLEYDDCKESGEDFVLPRSILQMAKESRGVIEVRLKRNGEDLLLMRIKG